MALTPEEKSAALAVAHPDLAYLLDEHEVAADTQALLYHQGFTSLRRCVGLEETKEKVREVLRVSFSLGASAGLPQRRAVADLLAAWDSARVQWAKESLLRAEARASSQPVLLSGPEHRALRAGHELKWGKLPNEEVPGSTT